MRWSLIAAPLAALILAAAGTASAAPVRTEGGLVEGAAEGGLTVYKGVPFAAAPINSLRWRAPRTVVPWQDVKQTTAFALPCAQGGAAPSAEDCLYLNVWTPAAKAGARLPVMVWIYGGAMAVGATSDPRFDGASLAKRGVVVVSIAYRVGALGFLAHPDLTREGGGKGVGTYGLMDQIAGLQWIKRNIAAFGGDPGRVTIFGQSAGGQSVSMLAGSPRAKGLFQRAISQSGGSFSPAKAAGEGGQYIPTIATAERTGVALMARLNVSGIPEARKLPVADILKITGNARGTYWPVMDGYVLTGDQYEAYAAHRYNDVPVLIGTNADEGALTPKPASAAAYLTTTRNAYGDYADRILAAYPATEAAYQRSAQDIFREGTFAWHTWAWANLQSRAGRGKVFAYYFEHVPPWPDQPAYKDRGAAHGAEVPYVFGTFDKQPEMTYRPIDRAVSETMQAYWVNFARTGDPNGPGLPTWPAYSEGRPQVMHFADKPTLGGVANLDKLKVLDGYFAWRRAQMATRKP